MKLLLKSHAVNSTALLDDASNIRSTINRRLTPVDEAMEVGSQTFVRPSPTRSDAHSIVGACSQPAVPVLPLL